MKFSFPAVFKVALDDDFGYDVDFPDIIGGVTCGEDMEDSIYMAKDVLKLLLEENANNAQKCKPSSIEKLKEKYPNDIIKLIEVEIEDKYLV